MTDTGGAEVAPEDFYTGLVAQLYGALKSESPDANIYQRFVLRAGQPALELGCGDGEPMLELRARGIDVEGVDSSLDMLERCRAAAGERHLDVVLHHATFQEMDLPRRFRAIYFAGATFNLLPDDDSAQRALERIAAHLESGGTALIPLFIPQPHQPRVGSRVERITPDGHTVALTVVAVDRDPEARIQTTRFLYESSAAGITQSLTRTWLIHWIEQDRFAQMANAAGLPVKAVSGPSGARALPEDTSFSFLLRSVEGV